MRRGEGGDVRIDVTSTTTTTTTPSMTTTTPSTTTNDRRTRSRIAHTPSRRSHARRQSFSDASKRGRVARASRLRVADARVGDDDRATHARARALALASIAFVSMCANDHALAFEIGGDRVAQAYANANDYAYATSDLAVDLASPLAAYWCVTKALRQEIPLWLNFTIAFAVCAATVVCVTGNGALDAYLR